MVKVAPHLQIQKISIVPVPIPDILQNPKEEGGLDEEIAIEVRKEFTSLISPELIKAKSCAAGISPSAIDHYKDKDSSVVLQNSNDSFQDVITLIQAKMGWRKVC